MGTRNFIQLFSLILIFTTVIILSCGSSTPEILSFTILSDRFTANPNVRVEITTDNDSNVTGWFIAEASTKPSLDEPGWKVEKPETFKLNTNTTGNKTLYLWVRSGSSVSDEATASLRHVESGTEDTRDWNLRFDADNSDDYAQKVALDSQENVYVIGYGTNLAGDSSGKDWWIKKFDSDGNEDTVNWNKKIDGGDNEDDAANSIAIDSSDNIYVVGYGTNLVGPATLKDWWIKKFDSEGNEDTTNWNLKFHGGVGYDIANDIALDSNGNVYVIGFGYGVSSGTNSDWWIKKFDSEGNEDTTNWNLKIDGGSGDDSPVAIDIDSDDNIYVAGLRYSPISIFDWWIKKFNSSGSEITTGWNKIIFSSGTGIDSASDLTVDNEGNVYVVGYGQNLVTASTETDWWIKKYNSSGVEDTTNWNNKYYDSGVGDNDYPSAIALGMKDDLFVAGAASNLDKSNSNLDWWVRNFNILSTIDYLTWDKVYDYWYNDDMAKSIVVTPEGTVYVVGVTEDNTSKFDWCIKKFAYYSSGGHLLK